MFISAFMSVTLTFKASVKKTNPRPLVGRFHQIVITNVRFSRADIAVLPRVMSALSAESEHSLARTARPLWGYDALREVR